ncbi:HAD family hydrolase [Bizionia sp. KMM 8389]
MIKTLIFDFGDVFINLDKVGALANALSLFGTDTIDEEFVAINCLYEQGLIDTNEFLEFYLENFPNITKDELIDLWNCLLKDFPAHRLTFLKELAASKKYQLILLSNTNELHIDWIKAEVPFYEEFKKQFDVFYLSHEIGLRKPNADIFNFVLNSNNLEATECFFIDDTTENTEAAKQLGIHTWNINPETEDIVNLFSINKHAF